jgi:hypothetical protein
MHLAGHATVGLTIEATVYLTIRPETATPVHGA